MHLKLRPQCRVNINTIFLQLTRKSDFLPKLETLYIDFPAGGVSGVTPATASIVVQMLCWRWSAVGSARLKLFEMMHTSEESVFEKAIKFDPEFKRLKKEGMALKLYKGEGWWLHHDAYMR
jgi:hypothetical protein